MLRNLEELLAEVRASNVWDQQYLNSSHPNETEQAAWEARRKRLEEISREIGRTTTAERPRN